jgi:hypothetical protein
MLRRALLAVLALALAVVGAGCATADGRRAGELLQQAHAAQAELESMTFRMRMSGDVAGQAFTMTMDGGGYLKGDQAGDMVMQGVVEGAGVPATSFSAVIRDGRAYAGFGGIWTEMPVPAGADATAQLESQLAAFDFTQYVKDVSIDDTTVFLGEPVTKIVGVIDTADMLGALSGQLGDLSQLGGAGLPADFIDGLGDTRIVVYVSDETHHVRAAHMSFNLEQQGQKMTMDIDYSLQGVNEPIEIPEPDLTIA